MRDGYLTKIAAVPVAPAAPTTPVQSTPDPNRDRGARTLAAGLAGSMAGGVANMGIAPALVESLEKTRGSKLPAAELSALKQRMGVNMPVYHNPNIMSQMYVPKGGMMPKFMKPVEEAAYTQRGIDPSVARKAISKGGIIADLAHPEYVGHELGHGAMRNNKLLNAIVKLRGLGMPLGLLGGAMLSEMPDQGSAATLAAGAAPLVGAAPLLIDEGGASLKGYRALKGSGKYSPEVLKAMRKNLLKMFGSYATLPLGAAALLGGRGIYRYMQGRGDEAAEAPAEVPVKTSAVLDNDELLQKIAHRTDATMTRFRGKEKQANIASLLANLATHDRRAREELSELFSTEPPQRPYRMG